MRFVFSDHSTASPVVMSQIRVAVIGTGAAGLCTLRHLTTRQHVFSVTAFEQKAKVGGVWVFTERTGSDDTGLPSVPSCMYRNLRTNLAKEVMAFPDYEFDQDLPSFVHHSEVLRYLKSYSSKFNLHPYIQFQRIVLNIEPFEVPSETSRTGQGHMWHVTSAPVNDRNNSRTEEYDAVVICSGHYSSPFKPVCQGLESFPGEIMHSHKYRDPEHFEGRTVLCLGAGVSGVDISIDIAAHTEQVYLCHNKPRIQSKLPPNVHQKPGIDHIDGATVTLTNGETLSPDCLLLCTGYQFHFPFLSSKCHVSVRDQRITPLYKHVLHTQFPTLSFIGIIFNICPFQLFHVQVQFALSVLDGSCRLPSKEEMDADMEAEFQTRLGEGLPPRYAHFMGKRQWEYSDEIARMAGCEPISQAVRNLFSYIHATRVHDYLRFKDINYRLRDFEQSE